MQIVIQVVWDTLLIMRLLHGGVLESGDDDDDDDGDGGVWFVLGMDSVSGENYRECRVVLGETSVRMCPAISLLDHPTLG
jgi:hypothetical protein